MKRVTVRVARKEGRVKGTAKSVAGWGQTESACRAYGAARRPVHAR
jgi:hypothetical protein